MTTEQAPKCVKALDALTAKLKAAHAKAICEVCGKTFEYLKTPKNIKHKPRACKGHCTLVLEEREGRRVKENWNVIRERRKP